MMRIQVLLRMTLSVLALSLATQPSLAADWIQFRGPNGAGISADTNVPLTWSDTENLRWKVELPGPGSSSPIVLGDRIFVTCYSGYGVPQANGGDIKSLQRHLVCVERSDGKIRWTKTVPGELPEDSYQGYISEHQLTGNTCPSIIADGETVFVFGGFRSAGSLAVRSGGQGDVTKSHVQWSSRNSSYVATPVLHEGHLDWISDSGQAFGTVAKTGELVYRERVAELKAGGRPVYASPVVADGKIYVPSRWDGVLVLPAKPEYKVLARNQFVGDESNFNATPAISNNQMFLRSNRFL